MIEASTPLMRQYQAIKKNYPHALVLFRLGDFYELFYEDAMAASRELQITLTSRNRERGEPIPMCGVPYHAAETYIARLLRAGYKIAVCDQMEQPAPGRKLVRRDVVRVITPGTATDLHLLEPKENNFLAAVARAAAGVPIGLAFVDVSTGEFRATEFSGAAAEEKLRDELQLLRPRELLLPRQSGLFSVGGTRPETSSALAGAWPGAAREAIETRLEEWVFLTHHAERLLREQFGVAGLEGFGLAGHPQTIAAAGALLHYLRETSGVRDERDERNPTKPSAAASDIKSSSALHHLDIVRYYEQQDALVLDATTVRNLELLAPLWGDEGAASAGSGGASLIAAIDRTATGMGARLLRAWLVRPEVDPAEIAARLDAVAELKSNTILREEIRQNLRGVQDLARLASRATLGLATPRELLTLRQSLGRLPLLRRFLGNCAAARLTALRAEMDDLTDIEHRLERTLSDDPPSLASDPGVIRRGFHKELDELRDLSQHSRQIIAAMEDRERKRTGIASLKIRYNQVFGFYLEITKPNLHLVPDDFERKQTLINAERFTTPELRDYERKVLAADERIAEMERQLFTELRAWVGQQAQRLRRTGAAVAQLDVLANLAHLAAERGWTRPDFTGDGADAAADYDGAAADAPAAAAAAAGAALNSAPAAPVHEGLNVGPGPLARPASLSPDPAAAASGSGAGELCILGGRHPVIELLLEEQGQRFVPNALYLNSASHQILLITGPNMGGKSTYLRQAALIVLLAQIGSFVPAEQARLPIIDRIFTRIGASDNLARGRSTFLVEMAEVAAILNLATPQSLVLLDEVGRGTATFDGLSIAWAVVEHLQAHTRARTLFATHYHELTELADLLSGVKNIHVCVEETPNEIVFLRRVEEGSADKSYGIEVARLAGLPRSVVERAREVLRRHEQSERQLSEKLSESLTPGAAETNGSHGQQALFTPIDREVLDSLRAADLDQLRPIEALNLLAELKKQIS